MKPVRREVEVGNPRRRWRREWNGVREGKKRRSVLKIEDV
jgi:hypothetical protein